MAIKVDLQNAAGFEPLPGPDQFENWVSAALLEPRGRFEQTIRIVDEYESRQLNHRFRGKPAATNVLAFVADDSHLDYDCLGDLVICGPIVDSEAREQGKPAQAHWAHLVVHGMLHLQGYDHLDDAQSAEMEALEIKILDTLGYINPYNE